MTSNFTDSISEAQAVGMVRASFRRTMVRALGLPMAYMFALAAFLTVEVLHLLALAGWVDHTDRVIAKVYRTQKLVVNMEAGLRGHIITGSQSFLKPYHDAEATIEADYEDLSRTVADNPPQVRRVDDLRADYARWHEYAREILADRARGDDDYRRFAPEVPRGKAIMDRIRARVDELIGVEEGLRDLRSRSAQRTARIVIGGCLVVTVLMGGLIGVTARRQLVGLSESYAGALSDLLKRTESLRCSDEEVRRLNAQLGRRLERLTALRRVDQAITASHDLRMTLEVVLDQVVSQLSVNAARVLLLDPYTCTLGYVAGRGFQGAGTGRSRLRLGDGHAGRAALDRRLVAVADLGASDRDSIPESLQGEGFVSYHGVPLMAKGNVNGVLEVFQRSPIAPDPEWLDFLEALADQVAIAVDNAGMFEGLARSNAMLINAYDATIEGWSRALDLRDHETDGHARRVTEAAVGLARAMGIDGEDLANLRRGALLHDIGKMGVPDSILLKPGPLDDEQREIMMRHPTYAYEWLAPVPFLRPGLEIPYGHHERWDGTGYPRKLAGEQIPLSARIFAAVNIWDALRSDRPYRPGWPEEKVRRHIRSLSGTHLDPRVVEVFLNLLESTDGGPPVGDCDPDGSSQTWAFAKG